MRPPSRVTEWHDRWERYPHLEHRGSPEARLWIPVIVAFLIQVPPSIFRARVLGTPETTTLLVAGVIIAAIGPLALIAARRYPGPVVAVVSAAASADLIVTSSSWGPPYIALAFALVGAIVRGARLWAWTAVSAAWLATLAIAIGLDLSWQPARIAGITLGILVVLGVGESMRTRRERFEQVGRTLAERRQTEVQAERVRIARELHDVLAHSLSQINVQASVGLHLAEKQPQTAVAALASIKETSKTALDEVRAVLGILRAEGGADVGAPLVPEPDLSRLPGLVASVSSQGVHVALDDRTAAGEAGGAVGAGAAAPVRPSAAVQLAVYRIVQESLTNVVRHSGATSATVTIAEVADTLEVTVRDNGSGAPQLELPRSPDGAHDAARDGTRRDGTVGRGLLGMHERAELLGGTLETRSSPTGFEVLVHIPLGADSDAPAVRASTVPATSAAERAPSP
ncbi:MAG: sensor histidine kinase [Burkholderiaceae bacterium]|nr:sensor histidine kinase [Microbacteriaceae bacterium]